MRISILPWAPKVNTTQATFFYPEVLAATKRFALADPSVLDSDPLYVAMDLEYYGFLNWMPLLTDVGLAQDWLKGRL